MKIEESDFYKVVNILVDFADWDTTKRQSHSLRACCNHKNNDLSPHETLLGKSMKLIIGINSSLAYMNLSIAQVSNTLISEELKTTGIKEYDLYRYHYIVFNHSIALLQDLLFKLASTIFELNIPQRMIGWKILEKELKKNNLTNILQILETFYNKFSNHIEKRNKFSHEGLLAYNSLDNFYLTHIYTSLSILNEDKQYIRETQKNIELLKETKEKFIEELNQFVSDAEQCVLEICDLCLEKLMSRIEHSFFEKHYQHIKDCDNGYLNNYLKDIGL